MPTSFSALPPNGFRGESIAGTWRLDIIDNDDADVGALGGWFITFSP